VIPRQAALSVDLEAVAGLEVSVAGLGQPRPRLDWDEELQVLVDCLVEAVLERAGSGDQGSNRDRRRRGGTERRQVL
jgi:hypothetical protein